MNPIRQQHGVSLIAALFVIVALGALAAVMGQLATTQQLTTRDAVEGKQAWYAARAGLEVARYRLVDDQDGCSAVDAELDWAGFKVTVLCEANSGVVAEGGVAYEIFKIKSTAEKSAGGDSGLINPIKREARASIWRKVSE